VFNFCPSILIHTAVGCIFFVAADVSRSAESSLDQLAKEFPQQVRPLVQKYCADCHSAKKKKGELDLTLFHTADDIRGATRVWQKVIRQLRDGEMPPKKHPQPSTDERKQLISWTEQFVLADAVQRAGDPGLVLMRRLTRAEYNYTIRDLTGIDLRPAEKFLEDSVAGEGFANTGEALFMAPDLIPKYLEAARQVSAHAVLTPSGIRFSPSNDPHDWTAEAAQRIQDFYARYTDRNGRLPLGDYLETTLRYRDRDPSVSLSLEEFAAQRSLTLGRKLSAKYLRILWTAFNDPRPTGVMSDVLRQWRASKTGAEEGLHVAAAHIVVANSSNPGAGMTFGVPVPYGIPDATGNTADQGFIWGSGSHVVVDFGTAKMIDRVYFVSGYGGGKRGAEMEISHASAPAGPYTVPQGGTIQYLTSIGGGVLRNGGAAPDSTGYYQYRFKPATARYWRIAMVRVTDRHMPRTTSIHFGPISDVANISGLQSRLWKINGQDNHLIGSIGLFGSHVMPLDEGSGMLRIDADEYASFAKLFPMAACFAPVIPVNRDVTVQLSLREDEALSRLILDEREHQQLDRLWDDLQYISQEPVEVLYNTKQFVGFQPADRIENTKKFSAMIPSLEATAAAFEQSVRAAEPRQLTAVIDLAARAWRRPLAEAEDNELRQLYETLRRKQKFSHEDALRGVLTRMLVSPHFLYRIERPADGEEAVILSDWELASRLSYFLWSSLPDDPLRTAAAGGGLQREDILTAQASRMLSDPRARALAIEFAGQWLQFRAFDQYEGKSESRFPEFTADLRSAMGQEAADFIMEIIRNDRSVLDILQADYTFLNDELAAHYKIPNVEGSSFRLVEGVSQFGRGGIVAMGSVLTKQSGALRTSPVLRGTWVVETLLGREIPNPPDDVPQLASDEVDKDRLTMRQRLERHRADAACATCHAKIDPYGFALEAYDPIGRLRDEDLLGNSIDAHAEQKNGKSFEGLRGLQTYLLENQDEFIKQFCQKLLGYALGRAVELSDEPLLADMQMQLAQNGYRFSAAVMPIVKSRQFRRHRSRNHPLETSR
jgi:hypothetical protein